MATALAINDVLRVKFYCDNTIQNGINVLGYVVTGLTVPGVTDQDAAAALSLQASGVYRPYLNLGGRYNGCNLQIVRPTLRPAVISLNGAGIGTVAGDPLPPQVAFLLSPRTAVAGRRGRGRTYLPFWSESQSDAGSVPTAGAVTLATTWSNAMFAILNVTVGGSTATLTPCIIGRAALPTNIPITHVVIRTKWATQRRRSLITKPDVLGP